MSNYRKIKTRLQESEALLKEAYSFIRAGAITQSNKVRVELEDKIHKYFYN